MDKKTQFEKTKKYYKILVNTVEKNKQEKKKLVGHRIFGLATNPIYDGISVCALTIALSFVLSIFAKLPAYFSIPAAAVGAFTTALAIPLAIRKAIFNSKKKIGRGYAKMELDSYFTSMKNYIKENMQNLVDSESYEDVSDDQLSQFAFVFGNITKNYKTALDKYVGRKIYNKTQKDFEKIKQLLSSENNQEKNRQKVKNIIEKSEKVLKPWCELYNTCGKTAKNLYEGSHELNPDFEILPDINFIADDELLRKKVNHYILANSPAKEVKKHVDLEDENQTESKAQTTKTNDEIVEKTFEDENEKNLLF